MAQRRRRPLVLQRAEEHVPRRLELAALPEALSEAIPCVDDGGVHLDGVGEGALGGVGKPTLLRARRRLAAQVHQTRLQAPPIQGRARLALCRLALGDCSERVGARVAHARRALLRVAQARVVQRIRRVHRALRLDKPRL